MNMMKRLDEIADDLERRDTQNEFSDLVAELRSLSDCELQEALDAGWRD